MALEIMSPAGSFESVVAAVRSGADAVYFGAGDFNARRNAKNLSDEELAEAIRYCHLRGVKTYITVNTLVTDRELEKARELILHLNKVGADALIVQDLGMARLIRSLAPDLPIHASTQLTIHNLAGIKAAKELGFSRVVLSRELPLSEIKFLCKSTDLEIEVFGHGALCMCYSGQCYMSALIGGRSGNRGLCAQPCRMAYSYFGDAPTYPLSLKDLAAAKHLRELEEAGVTALKIEGRMKRPEYVALVTSIYKKCTTTGQGPSRQDMMQLETMFSREGFTDGYLKHELGDHMFGTRKEGDGREVRALYKQVQTLYQSEPEPPTVPVTMAFSGAAGQPVTLTVRDEDGHECTVRGAVPEAAINRPTTRDEVRQNLQKTGGTVFKPGRIDIDLEDGLRIPAAAVNALRRQATEALAAARRLPPERRVGQWSAGMQRLSMAEKPKFIFSFLKLEQLTPALLNRRPDYIYLPLDQVHEHLDIVRGLQSKGQKIAAVLPRVTFDSEWPAVINKLRDLKAAGVDELVCTNIGHPALLAPLGFKLRGDFGLNVFNSQTLRELKAMGLGSATVSFEATLPQIRDLSHVTDLEMIAYGRLPLMIFENCAIKRRSGQCACGGSPVTLTDRTGRAFPLMPEPGCRNTLYNCEKLYLADRMKDLTSIGLTWLRLNFTTENPHECEQVAKDYLEGVAKAPDRITRGLYYRGVQ